MTRSKNTTRFGQTATSHDCTYPLAMQGVDVDANRSRRRDWRPSSAARCAGVLLMSLTITGCGNPHIALDVPHATVPMTERWEAYTQLRPLRKTHVQREFPDRRLDGTPITGVISGTVLNLGDGRILFHPEDLAPAVLPGSLTHQALQQIEELDAERDLIHIIAWSGVGLGGGLMFYAAAEQDPAILFTGLGIAGLSYLVGGALTAPIARKHSIAKERAFEAYDGDLKARLDLPATDTLNNESQDAPRE